jgi:hypothetical protein
MILFRYWTRLANGGLAELHRVNSIAILGSTVRAEVWSYGDERNMLRLGNAELTIPFSALLTIEAGGDTMLLATPTVEICTRVVRVDSSGTSAPTPTPTPSPTLSQPSISPTSGNVGQTFTATDGTVTNGTLTGRRWLLGTTAIGTGTTVTPAGAGTLTLENTATGTNGAVITSTSNAVTVSAVAATPAPSLSLSSAVTQAEGNSGTASFVWTLTLNRDGSTAAYPFNWAVTGSGSNPADAADFGGTLPSGSGTFAAGETTKTITVLATGDTAFEPNDTFTLSVIASGLATVTSTGTISNDDVSASNPIVLSFIGSSSPAEYLGTYTGGTPNANVQASDGGTNYGTLNQGRMGIEAGTAIYNATGRQVHYIRSGASGTTLAGWESDASSLLTNAIASINNAKATGRTMTGVLLQVGFNDVDFGSINSSSTAAQAALIRSLISKIRAGTSLPNLVFFIGTTQDEPDNPAALRFQREAEMLVSNNDANVRLGFSTYDLPTRDNTHQTEPSQVVTASRFAAQVLALVNGTAQKRAAYLTTAAAVSDTQTDVSVVHVGGTDFTPTTGITAFRVFNSAGAELAVSAAIRQSATKVRITHASKAGGTGSVIYMPNALAADDGTVLHDNSTLALPFDVTSSAIAIPAVAVSGDTTPPVITSGSTFSQPENSAFSITLTANETVTWSKVGGADAAKFTLSGSTLSLPAQDYEAPSDADTNRSYLVTVRATDAAGNTADQNVAVTITDVAEGSGAATGRVAQFDTGESGSVATPSGWNRWTYAAGTGLVATPFKTVQGADTTWVGSTVLNGDGGATNTGATTGNNSGVYPDAVLQSYYFNQNQATSTLKIAGLDTTKAYDLELTGSRTAADRYTDFIVNGVTKQLNAGFVEANGSPGNTSQVVTFSKIVPNASGEITFSFTKGTGPNGVVSGFGYFSGGRIIEYTP